jgi:hypothetical protein
VASDPAVPTPEEVAATVDHAAIDRLGRAYADVVVRRDWAALHDLFLPDTTVELDLVTAPPRSIVGPAAFGEFVGSAIDRFAFFEFVILNSHVDLAPDGDPDVAAARIFMCELRQAHDETERNDVFGCYRDTYRRIDGRWWFAHRRYRSMARYPEGVVFPLPADLGR